MHFTAAAPCTFPLLLRAKESFYTMRTQVDTEVGKGPPSGKGLKTCPRGECFWTQQGINQPSPHFWVGG